MNTIKYLKYKTICPQCKNKLHKNMNNEIYCTYCGLLVLDHFPNTNNAINQALQFSYKQYYKKKTKNKRKNKKKNMQRKKHEKC